MRKSDAIPLSVLNGTFFGSQLCFSKEVTQTWDWGQRSRKGWFVCDCVPLKQMSKPSGHAYGLATRPKVPMGRMKRQRMWTTDWQTSKHLCLAKNHIKDNSALCLPPITDPRTQSMKNKSSVSTRLMTYLSSPPADKREDLVWRISHRGKLTERRRDFSPLSHDCSSSQSYTYWSRRSAVPKFINKTIIGAGASWTS